MGTFLRHSVVTIIVVIIIITRKEGKYLCSATEDRPSCYSFSAVFTTPAPVAPRTKFQQNEAIMTELLTI